MQSILRYFQPRMLAIFMLGFYSGLPLLLTLGTLTAWLADAKVDRAAIGLFAAVGTPYAFKFLWAPLMDGVRLPLFSKLGRRRGWLLLIQILLALAIAAMVVADPAIDPLKTALVGVVIATLSASQDIVIDAYRVERLSEEEQGMGSAQVTLGYRIGMLVAGAGALWAADHIGWGQTYLAMAAIMASAVVLTLCMKEPVIASGSEAIQELQTAVHSGSPRSRWSLAMTDFLRDSVVAPFRDFMTRPHWLQVLAFVILYKLGDAFMGVMFNPFLLDLGFTKTQIAEVVKIYGLVATLLGTYAGGWLVLKYGMFRTLLVGGFIHMLTNLLLVEQAARGADVHFLIVSISAENFSGGISTAAFIAYLSALCKRHYTATQYALLSSLAAFGRTWLSTPSGALAQGVGWGWFFAIASTMAIPGLALLCWLERRNKATASI